MDRVSGPFKGYYIAVYACEMGELGTEYLGYFKVCRGLPSSYWEADCVIKDCTQRIFPSAEQAMSEAEVAAAHQIASLAPIHDSDARLQPWQLVRTSHPRRALP